MTRCYYAFPASNPSRQPFTLGQRWPHSPVLNSLIPQQSVPEPLLPLLTPDFRSPTGVPHMVTSILKDLADSTPALTPLKYKQRNRPYAVAPILQLPDDLD